MKLSKKTKTPSPKKVSKKGHLEMGFATKYSFKNYSSGVTVNSEFFCCRDFMEHSFILTLACLKQRLGVTWFCQLEVSILVSCFPHGSLICSVYVHSNCRTNTWTQTKSPFRHTIRSIYFILSFSVQRDNSTWKVLGKNRCKSPYTQKILEKFPTTLAFSKQNNPLPNTVIFITIIPDLKLHPYTP